MSNLHVKPSESHWLNKNDTEWTAESVEQFIKDHCKGLDVFRPVGAQILLIEPEIPDTITRNGLIIPNVHEEERIRATCVGKVLDFGPDAYKDKSLFPNGPFCKRGDWVLYPRYERTYVRITVDNKPMLLFVMYDTKVLGVAKDPSYIDGTPVG